MKYPRSLLRGYDREQEKIIANALHMQLKRKVTMKKKHVKVVKHR